MEEEGGEGRGWWWSQTDPLCGESDELSDAVNRGQGRAGHDCVGQTAISHGVKSNLSLCSWLSEYDRVQTWNFKPSHFHHYELLELTANMPTVTGLFGWRLSYLHIKVIMQIIRVNDDLII